MKVLVDENIPSMTVKALRELGHDVLDVRGTATEGSPDESLWRIAAAESRLLITTDRGFARKRTERHHGVLIVCLRQPNRHRIHNRIMDALSRLPERQWPGQTVVLRDRTQALWRRGSGGL